MALLHDKNKSILNGILSTNNLIFSAVTTKDSEVLQNTQATISCVVNGLTQQLNKVSWEKSSSGGVITDGTDDFKINVGKYEPGTNSQTTTLTIPAAKNTADLAYTCVIQCDEHGKTAQNEEKKTVNSNVFSKFSYIL